VSCAIPSDAKLDVVRARAALGRNDFMAPTAIVKFGIKKDRFTVEMGDEYTIDLAAIDHLQNCHQRLGRIEPT
jgi:hypothetical protein